MNKHETGFQKAINFMQRFLNIALKLDVPVKIDAQSGLGGQSGAVEVTSDTTGRTKRYNFQSDDAKN